MVIAFEGMDGVGKSTIASSVANNIGFEYDPQRIKSILNASDEDFNKFVKIIRTSKNDKLAFIFYSFRCMLDKESKNNLVVDRSMVSTYYFEHSKISDKEFEYIISLDSIPDIIFLLYASSDVRKERITNRDKYDEDLKSFEALTDGYPTMLEFIKKYNLPYVGIDTEKYDINEIINICSNIINEYSYIDDSEKSEYLSNKNDEYGFENKYILRRRLR